MSKKKIKKKERKKKKQKSEQVDYLTFSRTLAKVACMQPAAHVNIGAGFLKGPGVGFFFLAVKVHL